MAKLNRFREVTEGMRCDLRTDAGRLPALPAEEGRERAVAEVRRYQARALRFIDRTVAEARRLEGGLETEKRRAGSEASSDRRSIQKAAPRIAKDQRTQLEELGRELGEVHQKRMEILDKYAAALAVVLEVMAASRELAEGLTEGIDDLGEAELAERLRRYVEKLDGDDG